MKEILSGNEAVARGAFEAGVGFASAYPGTPSTEILENIAKYKEIKSEWSPNEKVAFEVAFGASMGGVRSLVAMKHVGVNVAADPLMTAAYTGVRGGLVLVSADDPGMHSSQNEQDNRNYARFAKIPMLEPSDSMEAKEFIKEAFDISEKFDTVVLFRMTTRICHAKSVVELGDRSERERIPYERNMEKFVMLPSSARKRRVVVEERLKALKEFAETTPLNKIEMKGTDLGIITSGVSYQYAKEAFPDASIFKLGLTNPLPIEKIKEFASKCKRVLVVEELDPVIEEQLKAYGMSVDGRNVVPGIGELSVDILKKATGEKVEEVETAPVPARPPVLCPGCPHRGIFYTIKRQKLIAMGDIGCYTLGALPPLSSMDLCLCMGASVGGAAGISAVLDDEQRKKVVGVIGDSTFFHSGITGIVETIYNHDRGVLLILDNRITAMTGHQEHPGSGKTLHGKEAKTVDIEKLCRGLGVERVIHADAFDLEALDRILKEERERDGLSVVIVEGGCVVHRRDLIKPPYMVDPEKCKECNMCFKVGCPAISKNQDGRTFIEAALCAGCGVCAQVCKFDAIGKKE